MQLDGKSTNGLEDWLQGEDTYTLHKPVRYRFPRRRVIVGGIDDQWEGDLVDVSSLAKFNRGYKYLLTVIDVLSKYAWVVPLKDKTGTTLVKAFTKILKQGRQPSLLHTDKGREFINSRFQSFLKDKGIGFFTTENDDIKASIVERFNRTLKSRMWRYFTKHRGGKEQSRYLPVLQDLVGAYNASYHRSIKTAPIKVNARNSHDIWHTLYDRDAAAASTLRKAPKFKTGARVRISKTRRTFKKGYLPNWSEELFTVVRRQPGVLPHVYTIQDDAGDLIKGTFYEQELQRVKDTTTVFLIDQILRRKGDRMFVSWLGYPASFNSWIRKSDLVNVYKR